MGTIKEYIKSVEVNTTILEFLKTSSRDRLGVIITFELVSYPNESISAIKVQEWFKHILAIVGYEYAHIQDRSFDEMAECWIMTDYDVLAIRHKYWSYKTFNLIAELLRTFCIDQEIPFKTK